MKASPLPLRPADTADIDNFCDALWLEDGLARATLASYRSDLGRLAGWLHQQSQEPLIDLRETTLTAFIAHLARQTRASSQARYLSTLPLYRFLASHSTSTESATSLNSGSPVNTPPFSWSAAVIAKASAYEMGWFALMCAAAKTV